MSMRLLSLLLTAALLGCSGNANTPGTPAESPTPKHPGQPPMPTSATSQTFTHTIATDTEYYLTGPQQARPPDGTMKAGTKVALVEEAGSYSRVRSEDGVDGYVVADSLEAVITNQ